jgi:hypothetical protein
MVRKVAGSNLAIDVYIFFVSFLSQNFWLGCLFEIAGHIALDRICVVTCLQCCTKI